MSWGRRWAQYVNAAGKQHCGTQAGGAVRTCLPMAETLEEPLERCTWNPPIVAGPWASHLQNGSADSRPWVGSCPWGGAGVAEAHFRPEGQAVPGR